MSISNEKKAVEKGGAGTLAIMGHVALGAGVKVERARQAKRLLWAPKAAKQQVMAGESAWRPTPEAELAALDFKQQTIAIDGHPEYSPFEILAAGPVTRRMNMTAGQRKRYNRKMRARAVAGMLKR